MNRRIFFTLLAAVSVYMISCGTVERFFIGKLEVSRNDYLGVDSTMIRSSMEDVSGDTITYTMDLGLFYKIDTISQPGRVLAVRRSEEEIEKLTRYLSSQRTESALLKNGDTMPNLTLKFPFSNDSIKLRDDLSGKVVMLNFWATWCGPCLKELETDKLPAIAEAFKNDPRFIFLPVSINHDLSEIEEFFASPKGEELNWLKSVTAWDQSGKICQILTRGGIPLTVIIDGNGVIRLNESGSFLTDEQLKKLRATIDSILK